MKLTKFADLRLHKNVLQAVTDLGYETPTPIQEQAIPQLLKNRDLLGIAQTGTGKTAAFALPTLDYLVRAPKPRREKKARVLVLAPTRELVSQIADSFKTYSKHMDCVVCTVFGGVKISNQFRALKKGVDVLVATPGRLVDLMSQNAVWFDGLDVLILDEADQMLDMGFIRDIKRILAKVPEDRQTMLFSATMPKAIGELASDYLNNPVEVSVTPESTTAERVVQGVYHATTGDKPRLLDAVLKDPAIERSIIFTRTKHGADKVVRRLNASQIDALAIHGNKTQGQRQRALDAFKSGRRNILVATDIAARGIDIDDITHVINYEMPNVPEQYVHRIGRTARAGREGHAISLIAADELYYLREVEKITGTRLNTLPVPQGCEDIVMSPPDPSAPVRKPKGPGQRGGGASRSGHRGSDARGSGKRPPRKPANGRDAARPAGEEGNTFDPLAERPHGKRRPAPTGKKPNAKPKRKGGPPNAEAAKGPRRGPGKPAQGGKPSASGPAQKRRRPKKAAAAG